MRGRLFEGEVKNAVLIFVGSLCLAYGVVALFIPNALVTGGTSGMALLLHYVLKLPAGMMMVAINVPLLWLGMRYLGKRFTMRSIITIVFTSVCIDGMVELLHVKALSQDIALASLFGGALIGVGLGSILSAGASAGGSTIVAKIIASKTSIKASSVILAIDVLIIVSIAVVFGNVDIALWSLVSIYVTAKSIDLFLSRGPSKKVVHIVSSQIDALSKAITLEFGKHGSILNAEGLAEHERKQMIFLVIESRHIPKLKEMILNVDNEAFMVVMEASELLGRGH